MAGQDRRRFCQLELTHTLQKNGFQVYITSGCQCTTTMQSASMLIATKQALQLAPREGWLVVSMKDDWGTASLRLPAEERMIG
jgi:hypothetical protein